MSPSRKRAQHVHGSFLLVDVEKSGRLTDSRVTQVRSTLKEWLKHAVKDTLGSEAVRHIRRNDRGDGWILAFSFQDQAKFLALLTGVVPALEKTIEEFNY